MQILEKLSLYEKITPQESYFSILHISQDNGVIILQRRQMQILKCSPSAKGFKFVGISRLYCTYIIVSEIIGFIFLNQCATTGRCQYRKNVVFRAPATLNSVDYVTEKLFFASDSRDPS
jgi:hypothetical protein